MRPDLLYRDWPYLALLLFCTGLLVRGSILWLQPQAVAKHPGEGRRLFSSGVLWPSSLIAVLLGHVAVLLFPDRVLTWNSVTFRLYLLEVSAFIAGSVAVIGWVQLVRRHINGSGAALLEVADSMLLSLVGTTLVSGLLLAWMHRWASSWAASTLSPYLHSFVSGPPRIDLVQRMPFLVRIHLTSGFATLAVLPFTRAGTALILGCWSAAGPLLGFVHAFMQRLRQALSAWLAELNLSQWLWPEED